MPVVIVIASLNPVKIQAVTNGFRRMFPDEVFMVQTVSVPSGVSRQPMSNAETLQGAVNRVAQAARLLPEADYWVGIEGGVEEMADSERQEPLQRPELLQRQEPLEMTAFAWVVVRDRSRAGRGRTGTFYLPPAVTDLLRQGKELGEADDIVFGRTNSKQENGAVGLLTGDVIDRSQLYEMAVILAFIPFKNLDLYPSVCSGNFLT